MTSDSTGPRALPWTDWLPLNGAWLGSFIPNTAGLYRIRRVGRDDLDYIGQTGSGTMSLRKRLAMLKGVYGGEMPYRDPHTAGPALWALVQHGIALEVSVACVEGTTPWRKGLECVALAQYREQHGRSPTVNFGRMPPGFRMSSGNNAKLVAAGKRFRGGRTAAEEACHAPSLPPCGPLTGSVSDARWHGLSWSPWHALDEAASRAVGHNGVYRIRGETEPLLLYIGQGVIASRVRAHLATRTATTPQGAVFARPARLECSYVVNDGWLDHQRLEVENDLIAAHVLALRAVPAAQFIG